MMGNRCAPAGAAHRCWQIGALLFLTFSRGFKPATECLSCVSLPVVMRAHRSATVGGDRQHRQERQLLRNISLFVLGAALALLAAGAPEAFAQSAPATDTAARSRSQPNASPDSGPDSWDANHDGVYTCDEWKKYLDRLFTLADHNRDGHLDTTEFATIRRADHTLADADFGYFDENQDGKITRAEFVGKPSEFILEHDKNGDCRVTPDEMKAATTEPAQGQHRKGR
jgi:EF hand